MGRGKCNKSTRKGPSHPKRTVKNDQPGWSLYSLLPKGGFIWPRTGPILPERRYEAFVKWAVCAFYGKLGPGAFRKACCEIFDKGYDRLDSGDRPTTHLNDVFHQNRWIVRLRQDCLWARIQDDDKPYVNYQAFLAFWEAIIGARKLFLEAEKAGAIPQDSIGDEMGALVPAVDRFLKKLGEDWVSVEDLILGYIRTIHYRIDDVLKEYLPDGHQILGRFAKFQVFKIVYAKKKDPPHMSWYFGLQQNSGHQASWEYVMGLVDDKCIDFNKIKFTEKYWALMDKQEQEAELSKLTRGIVLEEAKEYEVPGDEVPTSDNDDDGDDDMAGVAEDLDAMALEDETA